MAQVECRLWGTEEQLCPAGRVSGCVGVVFGWGRRIEVFGWVGMVDDSMFAVDSRAVGMVLVVEGRVVAVVGRTGVGGSGCRWLAIGLLGMRCVWLVPWC